MNFLLVQDLTGLEIVLIQRDVYHLIYYGLTILQYGQDNTDVTDVQADKSVKHKRKRKLYRENTNHNRIHI